MSDVRKHVRQPSEACHGGRRGTAMCPSWKQVPEPPVLTRDGRLYLALDGSPSYALGLKPIKKAFDILLRHLIDVFALAEVGELGRYMKVVGDAALAQWLVPRQPVPEVSKVFELVVCHFLAGLGGD